MAFVREINDGEDDAEYPTYVSEELPPQDAFRLAENKQMESPRADILVQLDADVEWNPAWGELR